MKQYLLSYEKPHNTLMNNPRLYVDNFKPIIISSIEQLEKYIKKNTDAFTNIDTSTFDKGFINYSYFPRICDVPRTEKLYLLEIIILTDEPQ